MQFIVEVGFGLLGYVIHKIWCALNASRWRRAWSKAAELLGYARRGLRLTGQHEEALAVELHVVHKGSKSWTAGRVSGPAMPPVSLRREGLFVSEDTQVGDKSVDRKLLLEGPEATLVAILDSEMRAELESLISDKEWSVAEGVLHAKSNNVLAEPEDIVGFSKSMTELAERLRLDRRSVFDRLCHNALNDPLSSVRARNLEVLLDFEERPDDPRVAQAAQRALSSKEPRLRLLGAILKKDATELESLARQAADLDAASNLRLIPALVSLRPPGTQATLMTLLDFDSSPVQVAAAEGLGALGDLQAVEALHRHTESWFGGDLKKASREAMIAIQARESATHAPGGLSLVTPVEQEGRLSVSEPAGGLSVPIDAALDEGA